MKAAFILTSAAFLLFISLLHLYWAAGGKWGLEVAIPRTPSDSEHLFRPGKGATVAVAILILGAGYLLLAKSGFVPPLLPQQFLQWGCILCAAVFFIRAVGDFRYVGFFKRVRQTRFARIDTRLYSPLCVWLGLAFVLALTA
ncbi:DUF3995 domain-containing protein [Brevibacillus choshinensis]|uniref:DUF3995 domain-containing protein n=1 Tax=Brevibacillus choshinensis TaxID=54911 RepID=A0ABX7FJH4_BRECH|nr:DUF3995 domain-containing protein [Brevibacillus choshinensis]QRG66015.1 DUF3995 domain-containing protein [Brevibacillus choshinensis]